MIENTKRRIRRWGFGMLAVAALSGAVMGGIESARADDAPAPTLPAYFTATNDPAKPAWPDPTGASGVWAAPAGDGKGDVPTDARHHRSSTTASPTTCSRSTIVWTLVTGFLVMFMQAGFMFVETGLCRAKNAVAHVGDELHDLPARLPRVLGLRLRDRLGQLVERSGGRRLVCVARSRPLGAERRHRHRRGGRRRRQRHRRLHLRPARDQGLLPEQLGERRRRHGALLLHDGVHGHHRHDPDRRHGRTLGVEELLSSTVCGWRCPTASMPTGCGAAAGWRRGGINWGLGHGAVDFAGSGVVHGDGRHHRPCRRRW